MLSGLSMYVVSVPVGIGRISRSGKLFNKAWHNPANCRVFASETVVAFSCFGIKCTVPGQIHPCPGKCISECFFSCCKPCTLRSYCTPSRDTRHDIFKSDACVNHCGSIRPKWATSVVVSVTEGVFKCPWHPRQRYQSLPNVSVNVF